MSKDAELLQAIGLGPEHNPGPWDNECTTCGKWIDDAAEDDGDDYFLSLCHCGTFRNVRFFVRQPLGLDCEPSEWTVEHDANFARWVWPWLRRNKIDATDLGEMSDFIFRHIHPSADEPAADLGDVLWEWFISEHPGPVMCGALYAALCK